HTHWVWLHEGADGVVWSGPDTPLFTLNEVVRGQWRRKIAPDGTLFAYTMNNYWHTNYAARQGGEYTCRFRISLLGAAPGGDAAEPVRRGWAACEALHVSPPYTNAPAGSPPRDSLHRGRRPVNYRAMNKPTTLGELKQTEWGSDARIRRTVKDELRENLICLLENGSPLFPGIVGYEDTVIPQLVNAI